MTLDDRIRAILGDSVLLNEDGSLDYVAMASEEFFRTLSDAQRVAYTNAQLGRLMRQQSLLNAGRANPDLNERLEQERIGAAAFEAAFGVPPSETAVQDWVTIRVQGLTGTEITDLIYALFAQSGSTPDVQPTDPVGLVSWQQAQALLMGARLGWYSQPVMYSPSGTGGGR